MSQTPVSLRTRSSGVPRRSLARFWLRNLVLIVGVTGGGIALALWWEDRPLRAIENSLDREQFDQALVLAEDYLRLYPDRTRGWQLKARALAGQQQWEHAARIFEKVGSDGPASERAWSQALLHLNRWSEALPLLLELRKTRPDDAALLHELAACHGQLADYEAAVEVAEALRRLPGQDDRARLLIGTLHERQGNHRLAVESWQAILDSNPDLTGLQIPPAEFLSAFGRALLNDGRADQALAVLERSYELEHDAETAAALGDACEQTGDPQRAQQLWKGALARDTGNMKARNGLARAALEHNAPAEALQWLEPMAGRSELPSATAYLFQRAMTQLGRKEDAARWGARVAKLREQEQRLELIDKGVQSAPDAFWSRAVRAHRYASQGNLRQAAQMVERLLEERPDEPFIRQLAEALEKKAPLPSFDLIPMTLH